MRASVYSGFTLLSCPVMPSKNQRFSSGETKAAQASKLPIPEGNHRQKVVTTAAAVTATAQSHSIHSHSQS